MNMKVFNFFSFIVVAVLQCTSLLVASAAEECEGECFLHHCVDVETCFASPPALQYVCLAKIRRVC